MQHLLAPLALCACSCAGTASERNLQCCCNARDPELGNTSVEASAGQDEGRLHSLRPLPPYKTSGHRRPCYPTCHSAASASQFAKRRVATSRLSSSKSSSGFESGKVWKSVTEFGNRPLQQGHFSLPAPNIAPADQNFASSIARPEGGKPCNIAVLDRQVLKHFEA